MVCSQKKKSSLLKREDVLTKKIGLARKSACSFGNSLSGVEGGNNFVVIKY